MDVPQAATAMQPDIESDTRIEGGGAEAPEPSRRNFLRFAPVAGAGVVAAACAPATAPPGDSVPAPLPVGGTPGLPPVPSAWANANGLHVARRLTWGSTPTLAAEIESKGLAPWLEQQLAWQSLDDSHIAPMVAPWPRPSWDAQQVKDTESWRVPTEMAAHETIRRIFSKRQLQELVADFWHDHFNVDANISPSQYHMPHYDRMVIRPLAFGKFSALLPAVAAHPAMLHYLDQASSRADNGRTPNENYARELMELHTVGSTAGYTQEDVVAVAHLLSGWSTSSSTSGFTFKANWHDPGPMTPTRQVLRWARGGLSGEAAGRAFLNHLAHHPATARRICHKLARRLIGEHIGPTSPVVNKAVNAYLSSDTSIAEVVRALVLSSEFVNSAGAKLRRPASLVTQMARALGLQWSPPSRPDDFLWANWSRLEQMGNANHSWPSPNGYPDANGFWLSAGSLVSRWNLAVWLAYGTVAGLPFDAKATMDWAPNKKWGEWLDRMALAIAGEPWPPAVRATVLAKYGVTDQTVFRSWDHNYAKPIVTVLLQTAGFQRS